MAIGAGQVLAGALVIELVGQTKKFAASMARGQKAVDDFTQNIYRQRQTLDAAGRALTAFGAVVTAVFIKAALDATRFAHGIAEIKTLGVDDALGDIADAVKEVSVKFGQEAPVVTKAYYDAVSAGVANSSEEVKKHLDVVGQLATVGVADVASANNLLSNTLNAYRASVEEAAHYSDVLFATVRGGKTTIQELAQHIGRVAPIAASAGLSIEELGASVAASTQPLGSTEMAVTGLRAAITNILKPTKDAEETAARLGIQFDIGAVKTQGWTAWLNQLFQATQGDTQALSNLFGSTEAYNFITSLAADNAATYNEQLGKMEKAAGLVAKMFEEMSQSGEFQLNRLKVAFQMLQVEIGENFVEAVAGGSRSMADLTEGARKFLAEHPALAKGISTVGIALGGTTIAAGKAVEGLGFLSMIAVATKTPLAALAKTTVLLTGKIALLTAGLVSWIEVGRKVIGWIDVWINRHKAAVAEEEAIAGEVALNLKAQEQGYKDLHDMQMQTTKERIEALHREAEEVKASSEKNVETKNQELTRINEQIEAYYARLLALMEKRGEDTTAIEKEFADRRVALLKESIQTVEGAEQAHGEKLVAIYDWRTGKLLESVEDLATAEPIILSEGEKQELDQLRKHIKATLDELSHLWWSRKELTKEEFGRLMGLKKELSDKDFEQLQQHRTARINLLADELGTLKQKEADYLGNRQDVTRESFDALIGISEDYGLQRAHLESAGQREVLGIATEEREKLKTLLEKANKELLERFVYWADYALGQKKKIISEFTGFGEEMTKAVEPAWINLLSITTNYMNQIGALVQTTINGMIEDLKRLKKELEDAAGRSWYTDAMKALVKQSWEGFGGMKVAATQSISATAASLRGLRTDLWSGPGTTRWLTPIAGAPGFAQAAPAGGGPEPGLTVNVVVNAGTASPRQVAHQTAEAVAREIRLARLGGF